MSSDSRSHIPRWIRRVLTNPRLGEEENRRRIVLALALIVIVPVLVGFALAHLVGGTIVEGSMLLLISAAVMAGVVVLRRVKNGDILFRVICGLLGLMALYYVCWSGHDYTFLWMFPLPLAVLFLLGRREGSVWVVVAMAAVAFVLLFPETIHAQDYPQPLALRLFVSLSIVSVLSYGFEALRESYYERLASEHAELLASEAEVKTLSGLLPICANCKKIRDDEGYWNQVEVYVGGHTDISFSHAICPDCAETLYGITRERFKVIERERRIQEGEDVPEDT